MRHDFRTGGALVFPGMSPTRFQDSAKFMLINPVARRLVAEADDALGYSLVDRYRDTEGDYSEYAQVAFLVNCLALAEWAQDRFDPQPALCVGPSFGGKTAAAHTGVLDFADAVRLTMRLGQAPGVLVRREPPRRRHPLVHPRPASRTGPRARRTRRAR